MTNIMLGSIIPVDIFWQLIGEYRESEIRATNRELTKFPDTKRKGGRRTHTISIVSGTTSTWVKNGSFLSIHIDL